MSMIDALIEGLGSGEEIACRVRRTDQGHVQLVFQPSLDGGDENGPGGRDETERRVREALARPVKFTCADDGAVSEQIDASLREIAASRAPVHSALAEYAEHLRDAKKAAQSAGQGQGKPKSQGQSKAASQGQGAGAAATGVSTPTSAQASADASASSDQGASEAAEPAPASSEASNPATLI